MLNNLTLLLNNTPKVLNNITVMGNNTLQALNDEVKVVNNQWSSGIEFSGGAGMAKLCRCQDLNCISSGAGIRRHLPGPGCRDLIVSKLAAGIWPGLYRC